MMRIIPDRRSVEMYVGTMDEFLDSIGVSWADAEDRGCLDCPEHDNEGWPWSCPQSCPEKDSQLDWKDLEAGAGFGDFWAFIDTSGKRTEVKE